MWYIVCCMWYKCADDRLYGVGHEFVTFRYFCTYMKGTVNETLDWFKIVFDLTINCNMNTALAVTSLVNDVPCEIGDLFLN